MQFSIFYYARSKHKIERNKIFIRDDRPKGRFESHFEKHFKAFD